MSGKDIPRSINPELGFIVNANSKLAMQKSVRYGLGSSVIVSPRANQIYLKLTELINSGKKASTQDLLDI